MNCSLPGSSVHGILQARILEWVAFFFFFPPRDLPDLGIRPASPALAGGFFTTEPPGKPSKSILGKKIGGLFENGLDLGRRRGMLAWFPWGTKSRS